MGGAGRKGCMNSLCGEIPLKIRTRVFTTAFWPKLTNPRSFPVGHLLWTCNLYLKMPAAEVSKPTRKRAVSVVGGGSVAKGKRATKMKVAEKCQCCGGAPKLAGVMNPNALDWAETSKVGSGVVPIGDLCLGCDTDRLNHYLTRPHTF